MFIHKGVQLQQRFTGIELSRRSKLISDKTDYFFFFFLSVGATSQYLQMNSPKNWFETKKRNTNLLEL